MKNSEIIKIKELAGNIRQEDYEKYNDKNSKNDELNTWYSNAQEELLFRVKNGETPIKVINDLSRDFSNYFDSSVDMFNLAFDALMKKAWQFGIKCKNEDEIDNSLA
ncbi:MAG: hypothetical protein NZZ41_05590 [Candidatus Dojkabacteria bacterium]|nr:hypothetical protein [Candidatus Dojkabacteria bacterium]